MPNLDAEASFESTKARVAEAIKSQFPFEGTKRRLELVELTFDEKAATPSEPHHIDNIEEQFKSRTTGMTWGVPIRGRLRLIDKETKAPVEEATVTLARLPKLTKRYSYIIDGAERQHDSVFRSMPRPYHRIAANGDIQGRWNLARGRGFDLDYDPEKGRLTMTAGTSANVPLYTVLKVLGISNASMEEAWGPVVFRENVKSAQHERDVEKMYKALALRMSDRSVPTIEQKAVRVREYFDKETEVWPEAMKSAFGKPYTTVNGENLLLSSKRLLDIQKGRTKEDPKPHEMPDDRQALSSKYLTTTEDFLVESIKKSDTMLRRQVQDKIDKPEYGISDIFGTNAYKKTIMAPFNHSQRPDQTNPLQFLSGYTRTTIRGAEFGGVGSDKINLDVDKQINPTHLGFLDSIQTPECYTPDTEVFTQTGWKKWGDVQRDDFLACRVEGRLEFHPPEKLHRSEYRGPMYGLEASKISYLVTPNHRVFSRPLGGKRWTIERADEVHGRDRTFACTHEAYLGYESVVAFELPRVDGNNSSKNADRIDIDDWAEFVGWYLAEGSFTYDEDCAVGPRSRYMVRISQSRVVNPTKYARIAALLGRMPFSWCETGDDGFAIHTKQIAHYCRQFGFCEDKFIPEDLFLAPIAARALLLEALLLGDGRLGSKRGYQQEVFTTASPRLAADVERLAIGLGRSVSHKVYKDERAERYLDIHEVRLLQHPERSARTAHPNYPARYWTEEYEGEVFCATVPGGLLLVRRDDTSIGFWCGNSEDTGIALQLPLGVAVTRAAGLAPGSKSRQSSGQIIQTRVYDVKAGQTILASPADLEHAITAFPDQVRWVNGKPVPIASEVVCYDEERRTSKRPWSKVKYVMPSAKALFSFASNLIPFLQNDSGNRASMAAKQQEQAVSLVHREAPLVQVKTDGAVTFEDVVGRFAAHHAPVAGVIEKIEAGAIHLKTAAGSVRVPVYDHYPLNGGKGMMHATPVVKVGDKVEKGGLLADTNFTKNGQLAMGANLRVAFLPYKGLNFEDGIVISESAATKMASNQMVQQEITLYTGMIGVEPNARAKWVDYATPDRATGSRIGKLDDRGIIREGMEVHEGDVLVAALSPTQRAAEDVIAERIHKSLVKPYRDASLIWNHDYPGKVVKVIVSEGVNRRKVLVHVTAQPPLSVGDKLAGRHGNKGIISRIVPDHLMPYTGAKDAKAHIDVLLNPAGVPSRMNVGQVLETAASKIAEKTGKPYVIENFTSGVDYAQKVKDDLKKHGLTDTEETFDPETGRSIGQVMVGKQYMHQLHHMVEKKMTARSFGTGYTAEGDAPSGSGIPGGGQKMDMLTTYALLAHGSKANLREAQTFKSDEDQNAVWGAVMMGHPLPPPQPTRGMKNFQDYLRALGVNTEKKGDEYVMMPMTDGHLIGDKKRNLPGISNGEIKLPEKLTLARGTRVIEETKGLFDPKITGGSKGKFWSHVVLAERMPNPLFEPAIQALTGITKQQYEGLVGEKPQAGGHNGFEIIHDKLAKIDVDKELAAERKHLATASKNELNATLRRIRYLEALKEQNLSPIDAYTNKVLPVLPPSVRRMSIGLDGTQVLDDRNGLYLAVGQANGALKNVDRSNTTEATQKSRASLYRTIRELKMTGMTSTSGGKPRHYQGLMELLSGKTDDSGAPKESLYQSGVLARRQDLSARSTIVPEPTLGLDEVGIPIPVAMEMYRPFVVRELVKEGKNAMEADKLVRGKKDTPQVMGALERAVATRPVMFKRDPALHKFSIMAFHPKLVGGKAIQMHPLVTGGFNADFDGDAMGLYVPVSQEAVDEAHKMMPSQNVFSPTHYGVMPIPSQDSLLGIYQASKWGKAVEHPANLTAEKATQMMEDGKLKPTDVVTIGGKKTTPGRLSLAAHLPHEMQSDEKLLHDPTYLLDKKNLSGMLTRVGKDHHQSFPVLVDAWKDLGNKLSYLNGSSFSINDFHDGSKFRDEVLVKYKKEEATLHKTPMTGYKRDAAIVKLYGDAQTELKDLGTKRYNGKDNRVWEWAQSGGRGNWGQFSQMTVAPILVEDSMKRTVPIPITRSYGEGLSISEYMASMHGARKGTLDRVQGTMEPGAVSKDVINTVINTHITAEDCGSTEGVLLKPNDVDATDRYLAKPVKLPDGTEIPAGELVTPTLATKLMNAGVGKVLLRSPLYCKMSKGICMKCFGLNENGRHHAVGANIGVIAGQALGEPMVQLSMKCSDGVITDAHLCVWAMSDYFAEHGEEEYVDGDLRTRAVDGEEIVDAGRLTNVYAMQTHAPEDTMVFISTRSGHALAVQANHPLWVYDSNGQNERVVAAGCLDLKSDFLAVDHAPAAAVGTLRAPIDPYVLGFFLAEGTTRYGNGTKYYENIAVASVFSQHASLSKEGLVERLRAVPGIGTVSSHEKCVEVYDPQFAAQLAKVVRGRSSYVKRLPPGFNYWKDEELALLLAGWIDGDGTVYESSNVTAVKIYTSSFVALQQLEIIARRLHLRFAPVCVSRPDSTVQVKSRHANFSAELRFTKQCDLHRTIWGASARLQNLGAVKFAKHRLIDNEFDQVRVVKAMPKWILPVWDVKTASAGFTCGMLRNHNTFHQGGVAGQSSAMDAFSRAKQIFKAPEKLPDSATLATMSGKVDKVVVDARGGHTVTIDGKDHRVVTGQLLDDVKVGKEIQRGDSLSTGLINPHHLLEQTKDIGRTRDFLASELEKVYGNMTRRRNIETVVKAMTNLTEITDAPSGSPYRRGMTAPLNEVEAHNAEAHEFGHELVSHTPKLKALTQIPLTGTEDWLARLNYQRLKETYTEGAAQGWKSNIHSGHPIPALAHGAEFGLRPAVALPPPRHIGKLK